MSRHDQGGDHQLALDWFRLLIFWRGDYSGRSFQLDEWFCACLGDRDLDKIAILHPDVAGESGTHHRGVVPSELGNRVGQFLKPAVVDVAAVVHRITAHEHDLGRILRRRWRWRPKRVRDTAGRVAVKLRRPVARWEMRGETV